VFANVASETKFVKVLSIVELSAGNPLAETLTEVPAGPVEGEIAETVGGTMLKLTEGGLVLGSDI